MGLENKNVLMYYNNQTTVQVLQSGQVTCPFMQKCLRELRFHSDKFNFRIGEVYLSSSENCLADCLSRWHLLPTYSNTFHRLIVNQNLTETVVSDFKVCDFW